MASKLKGKKSKPAKKKTAQKKRGNYAAGSGVGKVKPTKKRAT